MLHLDQFEINVISVLVIFIRMISSVCTVYHYWKHKFSIQFSKNCLISHLWNSNYSSIKALSYTNYSMIIWTDNEIMRVTEWKRESRERQTEADRETETGVQGNMFISITQGHRVWVRANKLLICVVAGWLKKSDR